jgi:hypothetical protein
VTNAELEKLYDDFKKLLSPDQVGDFAIDMVNFQVGCCIQVERNNVNICLIFICRKIKEIGGIN